MAVCKRTLAFFLAIITLLSLGITPALAVDPDDQTLEAAPEPVVEQSGEEAPTPEDAPADADDPEDTDISGTEDVPEITDAPVDEETASNGGGPAVIPVPETGEEAPDGDDFTVMPAPLPEVVPDETGEAEQSEAEDAPEGSDEPEEAEHKQWPWTEPGNAISTILGGGRMLIAGDRLYYSEDGLWLDNGGAVLLANVDAENLNLSGEYLYYTVNDTVYRMPSGGGTPESVYTADTYIWQMYVMGDELRMIIGGNAYSYDMAENVLEKLDSPENLKGLIPTRYGNLYLTGDVFDYTLWAEQDALLSGIDSCYPDGDWLVVVNTAGTWQTGLAALFDGAVSLGEYSLHQEGLVGTGLSEEQQLANEAEYLESEKYLKIQEAIGSAPADGGIMTLSTSHVQTKTMTGNQQNIVLRAQQMAEVTWTPKKDRYAWGGNDPSYVSTKRARGIVLYSTDGTDCSTSYSIFKAGKTYKGIPYSQAVSTGYVGWDISIKEFLTAVNNPSSKFYSGYSTYSQTAPYYGSDCSGFVSWAWDLPYRCTCTSLLNFSKYIGTDYTKLQIGDALNNPNSHVMLVTDLGYDSKGNIVSVEITEQTPYKMRVTCYGEAITGKTYDTARLPLKSLTSYYLANGYSIYRRSCSSRPNVTEPSDDAGLSYAASPTMTVKANGPASATVTLKHENKNAIIYYTTDGSTPSAKSVKTKIYKSSFTVTAATNIRAIASVPGYDNSFPLNETISQATKPKLGTTSDAAFLDNGVYYVKSGDKLTFTSSSGATIYYTTNGSTPTTSSSSVSSGGTTSIKVTSSITVKAFAVKSGCVPSAVVTFKVQPGKVHTITVNDPFGFIQIGDSTGALDGKKFSVLEGKSITCKIKSVSGYTLGAIKVDGKTVSTSSGSYVFSNVTKDHTITAEIKLPFTDVSGSAWYAGAVAFVNAQGLFNGTSSTTFSPSSSMTRAMFITVLGRFANPGSSIANWSGKMGLTNGYDINVRSDTTTSSGRVTQLEAAGQYISILSTVSVGKDGGTWYQVKYGGQTGYVRSTMPSTGKVLVSVCNFNDLTGASVKYCNGYAQWAYLNGIISGVSDTKFNASGAISRQDICVILYNYLTKYRGMKVATGNKTFSDSAKISSYAKTAVSAMANIGIVQGDNNGNFNPTYAATRAEVATMFMRLYEYLN